MYAIKRLDYLTRNFNEYKSNGCSSGFTYLGSPWNDSLPSDPELISSIFCHLLDISYFGSQPPRQNALHQINHMLTSSQVSSVYFLPED